MHQSNMAKSPEPGAKTFDEAVSLTGIGKFNLFVLLATGGSLMCVIIETMSAMFVTPAAQCDLNLSLGQKGLLYSISFFGVVSGSFLWGYLADTKGRKLVTIISLVTSSIISIIGSFVSTVWLFILLRYLNGFFIGGSSAITYAYAGEFHDNKCRPKVVSWIATFVAFGNIYLPGLAWVILPQEWSLNLPFDIYFRPWRLLIIIYSLPSLLFLMLVIFLPESPKYLMAQGKHKEAFEILQLIFTVNTGKKREEYPVKTILWEDEGNVKHEKNESVLDSIWQQFVPLFRKRFILKTFMVCFLQFAIFLSSSAVIMWYPEILNSMTELGKRLPDNEITLCKAVLYTDDTVDVTLDNFYVESALMNYQNRTSRAIMSKVCNDNVNEEVFLTSLVIGCCYAICYVTIGSVINLVGARKLLSGFILFTTISGIGAQMLSSSLYIQVTLCIFLMAATGIGIVNAIVVDLYPTQIRGMALAVSLMFGRFGAMTGSNAIGPILFNFCDYLFYAIAALHAVVIIVIILLPTNKSTPQNTKQIS